MGGVALTAAVVGMMYDESGLARKLHAWRKTQTLAGCGWEFGSVVAGEVLCPCRTDAAAILATDELRPDHRMCACGHSGSVHDAEPEAAITKLGYAVAGAGACFGSTDGGKKCPCPAFAARLAGPSDEAAETP